MSLGPRITIIIAVYNAAATLPRCLDSIAEQSYGTKEVIVMDGGSTDGSVEMLHARSDEITYWESNADRGIYHAWNKALAVASGEWICFLGADDYFWSDDVLERLSSWLQQAPSSINVVYGQVAVVSGAGEVLRYDGQPWTSAKSRFTRTMNIPHPGLMHRRALFAQHGIFDETLKIAADYDLLLRELKHGDALFASDITVVGMQHGGISYSPSAMTQMLEEQAQIRRKHGLPPLNDWRSMSPTLVKMTLCALATRWFGENSFRRLADGYRRLTGRAPIWR